MMLTLLVGVMCLAASVLRLGAIADFLSRPIIVGFMNGLALSIVLGQLGPLFGIRLAAEGFFPRVARVPGEACRARTCPRWRGPGVPRCAAGRGALLRRDCRRRWWRW
jgi:hypothetical protein